MLLESKGFRFKEAQVHSPISFLAHAMGEVWAEGFKREQGEIWVRFCKVFPDEMGRATGMNMWKEHESNLKGLPKKTPTQI